VAAATDDVQAEEGYPAACQACIVHVLNDVNGHTVIQTENCRKPALVEGTVHLSESTTTSYTAVKVTRAALYVLALYLRGVRSPLEA